MFDVGFSEMVVIAVVALIVIGPERLPKVARTIGHLIGRMNRYVNDVKADINREMELEELRKFKEEFQDAAQSVEQTIYKQLGSAQTGLESLEKSVTDGAGPTRPSEVPAPAQTVAEGASSDLPAAVPVGQKVSST